MTRTTLLLAAVLTLSAPAASAQWTSFTSGGNTYHHLTSPSSSLFVAPFATTSDLPAGRFDIRFPDSGWPARISFDDREFYNGNRVTTENPSIRFYRPTGAGIGNPSQPTAYVWWIENNQGSQSGIIGGLAFRSRQQHDGSYQQPHGSEAGVDMVTRLLIRGDGNVGIGTTNPTHLLSVNGAIKAREVVVTDLNWADYVFEPGYDLMPLSELAQFIEEEGHLPDVPTTAEVAENGVELGDMQALLLQKIEEMTLHLIAQDAEIERLRASVRELQGGSE